MEIAFSFLWHETPSYKRYFKKTFDCGVFLAIKHMKRWNKRIKVLKIFLKIYGRSIIQAMVRFFQVVSQI